MNLTNAQMRKSLLVLSGPSGVGKSRLERAMAETYGVPYLVSVTTREKRVGEVEGDSYYFTTPGIFKRELASGYMVEHCEIYGDYYGLVDSEIENKIRNSVMGCAVLVSNTFGFRQIKDLWPDVWGVWIDAPEDSFKILESRMGARGDTPDKIEKRLSTVERERKDAELIGYDFKVVNRDFYTCLAELFNIVCAMRMRK